MIRSSLDSIERVGSKLSYSDFKDFLRAVAATFPSGTEEYTFLSDLLSTVKTDLAFTKKLFSLLQEEPKITDSAPYGFSWELMSPTETGKVIFKKLEEVDPESSHDLYEFMSYVQLNYQSGLESEPTEEPAGSEEPSEEPEKPATALEGDVVDATKERPLSQSGAKAPILSQDGLQVFRVDTFEDFNGYFPGAFGITQSEFQDYLVQGGPSYVFVKNGQTPYAWQKDAGLVDSADKNLSREQAISVFGESSVALLENQFPELQGTYAVVEAIKPDPEAEPEEHPENPENEPEKDEEVLLSAADPELIQSIRFRKSRSPIKHKSENDRKARQGRRVKVARDIVMVVPKGTTGTVMDIPMHGKLLVQFDDQDFNSPVVIQDNLVEVDNNFEEDAQFEQYDHASQTDEDEAARFGAGRSSVSSNAIGWAARKVQKWREDRDPKVSVKKGAKIVLARKAKIVIPEGTIGHLVEFVDSRNAVIDFGTQSKSPFVEPVVLPTKFFVVASSAQPITEADAPVQPKITFPSGTRERLRAQVGKIHPGVIVFALRKLRGEMSSERKVGTILDFNLYPGDPEASLATVLWSDGIKSEIPMSYVQSLLFNSLNKSGAKLAVVSAVKEANGKLQFVLTGLAPAKAKNSYRQVFSGKVVLSKEDFGKLGIKPAVKLYSGKSLAKLFSACEKLEGSMVAVKSYRFGRTFVTDRAAVIVSSGPHGMFAVKTPVVYVKASKGYTLFKKVGDSYISSSGHRFRAIKASVYGKPQYLMVANAAKEYFKTQGRITCDAHRILERTQLILQRKAVRQAIVSQQKALAQVIASKKALAQSMAAVKTENEQLVKSAAEQASTIKTLTARIVSAKKPEAPSKEALDRDSKIAAGANRMAARMAGL